jgi:signal transduction histidine kinase
MAIKLLVIDDEDIIRDIWESMFTIDDNYSIETREDGEKGIAALKKSDFDIVITDLNMPGINGIGVVEQVKKLKPEIEIIIMTAFGTVEHAVEAMKKGAYDFILKPLDFERIKHVLNRCYKQLMFKRENKDLKELNEKLKELNEEKEKFITITSHELRTPTNSISGLTKILYEVLPEKIKDDFKKEFNILLASCDNLKDIVEEMHELSIASTGGLKLHKDRFSIDDLEEKIEMSYNIFARERQLKWHMENKLKGELFLGDFKRIIKALNELIQNAVKYTKDGGDISVIIDSENGGVGKFLAIKVSDTGIGIADDQIDKIFSSFYEVQDSTKHHTSKTEFMGGGIGLGLSIVREVAHAHSGKVTVESEVSRGSQFKMSLPYKK